MTERALGNDPNEGNHITCAFSRLLVNVKDEYNDSAGYAESLKETGRPDTYVSDAGAIPRTLFTSVAGIDTVDPVDLREMAQKLKEGIKMRENFDHHNAAVDATRAHVAGYVRQIRYDLSAEVEGPNDFEFETATAMDCYP
jgi:hypothetical protein